MDIEADTIGEQEVRNSVPKNKLSDEERALLVLDIQNVIRRIAREYRSRLHDLTQRELHQIGNLGAIKAAQRFDSERHVKFSTYAAWWIRSELRKRIAEEGRTIKWPAHIYEKRAKLRVCRRETDKNRDEKQIALERGLNEKQIHNTVNALNTRTISMAAKIRVKHDDDESPCLEDTISDKNRKSPEQDLLEKEQGRIVQAALRQLKDKNPLFHEIIDQLFGLSSGEEITIKELGERINMGKEAIRLRREKAILELRKSFKKLDFEAA